MYFVQLIKGTLLLLDMYSGERAMTASQTRVFFLQRIAITVEVLLFFFFIKKLVHVALCNEKART